MQYKASSNRESLVLIDARTLVRECLANWIEAANPRASVANFASVAEWLETPIEAPSGILFNIGAQSVREPSVTCDLRTLASTTPETPVIIMADSEELSEIFAAIDNGARGYLPHSVSRDVAIEAIQLALAGGTYFSTAGLSSLRRAVELKSDLNVVVDKDLTERQAAVANALRHGKPNKIIAFELNMSESTVKVHIRNLMRKLSASNRTEAAFILNSRLGSTS